MARKLSRKALNIPFLPIDGIWLGGWLAKSLTRSMMNVTTRKRAPKLHIWLEVTEPSSSEMAIVNLIHLFLLLLGSLLTWRANVPLTAVTQRHVNRNLDNESKAQKNWRAIEKKEEEMKVSRAFDANYMHTSIGQGRNRGFGREDFCAQTGRFTCFRVSFLTSLVSRIAVYITCMNYFYWMAIFPSIAFIIATAVVKPLDKPIGAAMRF